MKSITILLGLLSAVPHATVMAQIIRPVLPPIRPAHTPPKAPSIYSTNYPTATGNPHQTSNFSLSRTLSYATSRPSLTTTKTSTSTHTTTVTIVPLPGPALPYPRPIILPSPLIPASNPFVCKPDTLYCNTLTTFSLCAPVLGGDPPRPIYMGRVAAGTLCRNGRIVKATGGDCSPVGRLTCAEGGRKFFLCAEGGDLDMGPVARGTDCIDGKILAIDETW